MWSCEPRASAGCAHSDSLAAEAFFGLERSGDELVAAGTEGVYHFSGSRTSQPTLLPLPHFEEIGGVRVNFELPGLVLVLTEINRHSVSGAVPLLVPR